MIISVSQLSCVQESIKFWGEDVGYIYPSLYHLIVYCMCDDEIGLRNATCGVVKFIRTCYNNMPVCCTPLKVLVLAIQMAVYYIQMSVHYSFHVLLHEKFKRYIQYTLRLTSKGVGCSGRLCPPLPTPWIHHSQGFHHYILIS